MIESSDDLNPDIYKQIISDIRELINKEEGRYSTLTANIKNSIEKKSTLSQQLPKPLLNMPPGAHKSFLYSQTITQSLESILAP